MNAVRQPTFSDRLAEQRDRAIEQADCVQDARSLLTAKYQDEMEDLLEAEAYFRGKALATPPQETK